MATNNKTNATISINSVEIEIGGTKLRLTLEQVSELKKILAKAFPEPETKTVYVPGPERVIERRWPYPPMQLAKPPKWDQWEVTCKADTGIMSLAAAH